MGSLFKEFAPPLDSLAVLWRLGRAGPHANGAICRQHQLQHGSSLKSAVARLALFKRQIIFDGALYASGKLFSAFWCVQSPLVRQNISGEFAAFVIILGDHSLLR